jgi:hypothetical protein
MAGRRSVEGYIAAAVLGTIAVLGLLAPRLATARPGAARSSGAASAAASAPPSASLSASPSALPSASAADGSAAEVEKLANARRLFHEGNELRRAGDCQRALELYQRSRALVPSVPNTWNSAVCLDTLGRYDEALEMYETLLTEFRTTLSSEDRALIQPAFEGLRAKIGSLDLLCNVEGLLVVDGRMRGKVPLPGPIRLLPGKHVVQVIKEGYAPFETSTTVTLGHSAAVVARLQPLVDGGRVRVVDDALEGADVYIDGARVGVVPWEGMLEPGKHYLVLRKGEQGSQPTEVVVVKGQSVDATVTLASLGADLRVSVEPTSAEVRIDDVLVGHGRWQGRLPLGGHRLRAEEEGYFGAQRDITTGARDALEVTLRLRVDREHPRWGSTDTGRLWVEVLGGLAVASTLGSGAEASCQGERCTSNPAALGFLAGLRGGWEFPVRFSIELGAGALWLSKRVERRVEAPFYSASTATMVPATYALSDDVRLRGPFVGAGLGYRLPLGSLFELKASLMAGAYFAIARDDISGTASSSGRSVPIVAEGTGKDVQGADFFAMPELRLGLRFADLAIGAGLGVMLLALDGPSYETGDMRVVGSGCAPAVPGIDCAPGSNVAAHERAYGAALVWLPSLSAQYSF